MAEREAADALKKSPSKPKKAKVAKGVLKGFSAGEKDLYREVKKIKERTEAEERAELERTQAFFQERSYEGQPLPVPTKKAENRARFGLNSESALTEWEKN